jgi:hypothetical protein
VLNGVLSTTPDLLFRMTLDQPTSGLTELIELFAVGSARIAVVGHQAQGFELRKHGILDALREVSLVVVKARIHLPWENTS